MIYQCKYCSRSFDISYNLNRRLQKDQNRLLKTVDSMHYNANDITILIVLSAVKKKP